MRMRLVGLGFSLALSACATTQKTNEASTQECSLVDEDATGSRITKKQECRDVPGAQSAPAPQR
jgi:hypothetical protein